MKERMTFIADDNVINVLNIMQSKNMTPKQVIKSAMESKTLTDWISASIDSGTYKKDDMLIGIIEYCVWNDDTIISSPNDHYAISSTNEFNTTITYFNGETFPIMISHEDDLSCLSYNDGWSKDDAESLNSVINGRLIKIKNAQNQDKE